jgi:hypothetical protein
MRPSVESALHDGITEELLEDSGILAFYVGQRLLEHNLGLTESGRRLFNKLDDGFGQGSLRVAVKLLDDLLLRMTNTDGGEEAVGCELVFMHLGDTRLRFGDVDQKVLGLIEEGMEGLEDDAACIVNPQRAVVVV